MELGKMMMMRTFIILLISVDCILGELTGSGWRCGDGDIIQKEWVCDGYSNQCRDNSDESKEPGGGCNLFPDSGCPSPRGNMQYKCNRTGDCFDSQEKAEECESSNDTPDRNCTAASGGTGWKCRDGLCIELSNVCDGQDHCNDQSDESKEAYDGCNMFPGHVDSLTCPSWSGIRHVKCAANDVTCIPADMMKLVNASDPETCHLCPAMTNGWRCDDGQCINRTLLRNGIPDCLDNSDELPFKIYWYIILISTIIIVLLGLSVSLLCRIFYKHNAQALFHCNLCSSSRRNQLTRFNSIASKGDEVDCGEDGLEDDSYYPKDDFPIELLSLLEDKSVNWDIEERDAVATMLYGSKYSPKALRPDKILEAKKKYLLDVHMDPIRYHHLYMYFANRYATVKELSKVTKHLLDWEKEFHGESKLEVVKCWRLHLGSSHLTQTIINSVADNKTFGSLFESKLNPIRLFFRKMRRRVFGSKPLEDGWLYKLSSIAYVALVPFIEGCFFYLERLKNLIYIHIFYSALCDLSRNNPADHPFENSLIVAMCLAVVLTQLFFILISVWYAQDIFEIGHENECPSSTIKKVWFKIIAIILSPVIPILVLANHVYYDSKLSRQRRHLQTYKDTDESEDVPQDTTDDAKAKTQDQRLDLYKLICKLETKSMLYRKFYSYYRVTSALLESCTVIVCLVLIMFVTGRNNRKIQLVVGVEHRLYAFFNIDVHGGLFGELNVMRDIVMLGSIIYSLCIIITALVKYWYQSKNLSINVPGQFILGFYLAFMVANKLTTAISLFSTTQPLKFDDGNTKPVVTLTSAVILFIIIFLLRLSLVYTYKRWFSAGRNGCSKKNQEESRGKRLPRGWETGDFVDKWINVLINTIVVLPFMVQRDSLKVLKEIQKEFHFSPEKIQDKRNSLKRRTSLVKVEQGRTNGTDVVDSIGGVLMPNMNSFVAPLLYDDFRKEIRSMWWEDPTTKLDVQTIRKRLMEKKDMKSMLVSSKMDFETLDNNIKIILEHLECTGMVNTPLLNPVQTKREYFWLFMIVVLENLIALGIELINGGVWTSQGHYYSWDIRLLTFFLALVFLIMYYKKYHVTRDITSQPVCGGWLNYLPVCLCCSPDTALAAPPNEMAIENIVSSDNLDSLTKEFRSVEVQTDFEPYYSAFPPQRGNNGIIFKEKTGFSKSVSNFFSFGGGNKSTVPEENVSQETNTLITTEVSIENRSNSTKSSSLAPLATPEFSKSSSATPEIKKAPKEEIEMKTKSPVRATMI